MDKLRRIASVYGIALIVLLAVLTAGCSQGPNFCVETIIKRKITYNEDYAVYYVVSDDGARGAGWGAVKFIAHPDFAKPGDSIVFTDGALKAVK